MCVCVCVRARACTSIVQNTAVSHETHDSTGSAGLDSTEAVKTSTEAVKTSTEAVKTSTEAVKTSKSPVFCHDNCTRHAHMSIRLCQDGYCGRQITWTIAWTHYT